MKTLVTVVIFAASLASVAAEQRPCSSEVWMNHREEWEDFLRTAEVVSTEKVGLGVTKPKRVVLRRDDQEHPAVFKPLRPGRRGGFWESYLSEVAAYELDKILGLDMVPPTVVRAIGRQKGSLQLWMESCQMYKEVGSQAPHSAFWSHELSRMKMFDNLVANPDRNAGNILLGPAWDMILIDHSRAFTSQKKLDKDPAKLPAQFDRRLVERLEELTQQQLEERLDGVLQRGQIKALLARRDALLEHLEKIIAERGADGVLF